MLVTEYEKRIAFEESLCKFCGRCCMLKRPFGRFHHLIGKDCEHLRRLPDGTSRCANYDKRHEGFVGEKQGVQNVCISAKKAAVLGLLPDDCPYIEYYGRIGYRTRVWEWRTGRRVPQRIKDYGVDDEV